MLVVPVSAALWPRCGLIWGLQAALKRARVSAPLCY